MNMTLTEALELPFEAYMAWCRDWLKEKASQNSILMEVLSIAGTEGVQVLEIGWAKRYWYHHIRRIGYNWNQP